MTGVLHEVSDTAVLVDRALVLIIGTAVAMLALVTVVMPL